MLVKYVTNASVTTINIINDVALLCTGGSISDLSTGCDKVYTTILAKIVNPGWTLVDNAAPNTGVVISSPDVDGNIKYVRLSLVGASNNVSFDLFESWNATTHTGTNQSSYPAAVTATGGSKQTFYLYVTPRTIYFAKPATISNGIVTHNGGGTFEVSRDALYLKGTNYPAFCTGADQGLIPYGSGNSYSMVFPRIKNQSGVGDVTGTSALGMTGTICAKYYGAGGTVGSPGRPNRTATDATYYDFRDMWVLCSLSGSNGTILGKMYDVKEIAYGAANTGDTFSDGTDTYMAFLTNYGCFALKVA
jgi:hypothetical protein